MRNMNSERSSMAAQRKVGVPLIVGIVFLPLLFSWFLLRPGYSKRARLVAFGWLFTLFLFWLLSDGPEKKNMVHLGVEHPYTVIHLSDTSIAGTRSRSRAQAWIIASNAAFKEDRAATVYRAASQLRDRHAKDVMQVFLIPHDKLVGEGVHLATAMYIPDGCGLSGQDCGTSVWHVQAHGQVVDEKNLDIWLAWNHASEEFRDEPYGVIDEESLLSHISETLGLRKEEVLSTVASISMLSMHLESVYTSER